MATVTPITFTGDGPATVTYVSPGTHVLQVHRANPGRLTISAAIDDMIPVDVSRFGEWTEADAIISVDIPEGINITVTSATAVTTAKTSVPS